MTKLPEDQLHALQLRSPCHICRRRIKQIVEGTIVEYQPTDDTRPVMARPHRTRGC